MGTSYKKLFLGALIFALGLIVYNFSGMKVFAATGKETVSFSAYQSQDDARSMLTSVNNFRTKSNQWQYKSDGTKEYFNTNSSNKLGKLTYDYGLEKIAMQRAREIVLCYMSTHERPDGSPRRTCTYNGIYSDNENIYCGVLSAQEAQTGFEEENCNYSGQGHRRTMLNKLYTRIGIGHVKYMGRDYWVQEFGISGTGAEETTAINKNVTAKATILTADKVSQGPYFTNEQFHNGMYDDSYNRNITVVYGSTAKDFFNKAELPDMTYYTTWNLGYRTNLDAVIFDEEFKPTWQCTIKNQNIAELSGEYVMPKKAGSTTLTAICKDSNIGTVKRIFNIEVLPCSIKDMKVGLEYETAAYDGKAHTPKVVLKDSKGSTLVENTDYTVEYSSNISVGSGRIVISGKGNYSGYKYIYFEITPCEHDYVTEEMSSTSCTSAKCYKKTCSKCGNVIYEYGSPEGHNIVVDKAVAATCTSMGLTEGKHCSKCGLVTVEQRIVKKLGHQTELVAGYAPTCIKDGLTDGRKCIVCGEFTVLQEVIPASPKYHDNEEIKGYAPTCIKEGLSDGAKCKICGEITIPQEAIPASDRYHVRKEVEGYEPTCTEEGLSKGYVCDVCEKVIVEQYATEPLGHEAVIDKEVPATCISTGLSEGSHCGRCGTVLTEQEVIPKKSHTYSNYTIVKDVTCSEDGERKKVCKYCNDTVIETIKCTGHDPITWQKEEATCDKDGHYEGMKCSRCGIVLVEPVVIPAGHIYSAWTVTKEATCIETGERTAACERCGNVTTETIPKKEHKFEYTDYVPPKCTETGSSAGGKCSVCGEILAGSQVLPPTGHKYSGTPAITKVATCTETGISEKKCEVCGHIETEVIPAKGHTRTAIAGRDATCTEDGYTAGIYCSVCNTVLEGKTKIEAYGHKKVDDESKEATCAEAGYTAGSHCTVCGKVIVAQEVIPKKSHSFGEWKTTIEPTCLEGGVKEKKCQNCGFTQQRAIARTGHNVEKLDAVNATCEENGLSAGRYCKVCDLVLVPQRVLPATGHSEKILYGCPATCTEDGLTEGSICTRCSKVIKEQKKIEALGHDQMDMDRCEPTCTDYGWSKWSVCRRCNEILTKPEDIEPLGHDEVVDKAVTETCEEMGYSEGSHCGRCGLVLKSQDIVSALGHEYVEDEEIPATCTKDGLSSGLHCGRCNKVFSKQVVIPAQHKEKLELPKEPTCTEGGYTEYIYCEVCNAVIKERKEIAALGHQCENMEVTTKPSCVSDGLKHGVCSRCHEDVFETLPKLPHNMTHHPYVAPDCTHTGCKEYYECSECGIVYEDFEGTRQTGKTSLMINALQHNIVDGVCTICHAKFPGTGGNSGAGGLDDTGDKGGSSGTKVPGGLTSDKSGNDTSDKGSLDESDILDDTPVVGAGFTDERGYEFKVISDGKEPTAAFSDIEEEVSKLVIPDNVTKGDVTYKIVEIENDAFKDNKKLESVIIGENVTKVGDRAFAGCTKLKKVEMSAKVAVIGYKAFAGCSKLSKVSVPVTVNKIGRGAFKKCSGIKKITIPKGVCSIERDAFNGCKNLKIIIVKSTKIKTVGKNAFKGVPKSAVAKVPKKQRNKYKKLFKKAKFSGKII